MLSTRLFLSYLLLIAIVLLLTAAGLVFFLRDQPIVERQSAVRLGLLAFGLTRRGAELPPFDSPAGLQSWTGRVAEEAGVRVLVYSRAGKLLADSDPEASHRLEFPEPDAGADGEEAPGAVTRTQRVEDRGGGLWQVVARPLGAEHWLALAAPRSRYPLLDFFGQDLLGPLAQTGLVALVLSLILAAVIAGWVGGPLQRIARAVRSVATGAQDVTVPLEGPGEVQELASAFNQMAGQVRQSQQTQRDLVANVSHELKTPLTSIQGFAQAILDGTVDGDAGQTRAARVIYQEADRLQRLVDGLLVLARLDSSAPPVRAAVAMAPLLEGIAERLKPLAEEAGISLFTRIGPLPDITGDPDQLGQVVTNLLDNALKHTPAGGKVTLAAEARGGAIEITVSDTGPGIPPEHLPRIFERFYRADPARAGGGAGLGLAISREIATAHGGSLTAESVVGLGSKFILSLPVAPAGRGSRER